MRAQAKRVLDHLTRIGSDTDSNIGRSLDMPAPSGRRSIQELIHEGVPVSYAEHTGMYALTRQP